MLSTLKETWAAALTGADRGELEPGDEATLTMWRQRVVMPLLQRRMPDARYSGWGNALRIADALCSDGSFDPTGGSRPPVADVLNAAWIGRLRHWDDRARVDRIEQRARQLCGAQEVAR